MRCFVREMGGGMEETNVMSKACFSPFRSSKALVATVVLSLTNSGIWDWRVNRRSDR